MPFVASCPFCLGQLRVPDHARGASFPCPKCKNAFTLVPPDDLPAVSTPFFPLAGKNAANPNRGTGTVGGGNSTGVASSGTEGHTEEMTNPPLVTLPPDAVPDELATPCQKVSVPGVLAFFLGSMATLFASVPGLAFLTIPFAAGGFLLALAALFRWEGLSKKSALLTLGGGIVCCSLLLVIAFWPHLLGPGWIPARGPSDAVSQWVIPANSPRGTGPMAILEERLDVTQGAIRQGGVQLRVTEAWTELLEPGKASGKKGKERTLFLRLRVSNLGPEGLISYQGFHQAGGAPLVIKDDQGNEYPFRPQNLPGARAGRVIPPGKFVEDQFAFPAPGPKAKSLHLDLPASAVGGQGLFKLEIPVPWVDRPKLDPRPRPSGVKRPP